MDGHADETRVIRKPDFPAWNVCLLGWVSRRSWVATLLVLGVTSSSRQSPDQTSRMGKGAAELQIGILLCCLAGRGRAPGWGVTPCLWP